MIWWEISVLDLRKTGHNMQQMILWSQWLLGGVVVWDGNAVMAWHGTFPLEQILLHILRKGCTFFKWLCGCFKNMECLFIVAWRYSQNRFCPGVSWLWDCSLPVKQVGLVCALGLAGTVHALCLIVHQISAKCWLAIWLQPGCHTCVILISIIQNIAISTTIWNLHVKNAVLKC
jgi:hypothetical protein